MQTVADRFVYELKKIVLERIETNKDYLANGRAEGYPEYKFHVGHLTGLALLYELIEEADKAVQEL